MNLTARIWHEDGLFVAECLELGLASQGTTTQDAFDNLKEATELLLECADEAEIQSRLSGNLHDRQEVRKFAVSCG